VVDCSQFILCGLKFHVYLHRKLDLPTWGSVMVMGRSFSFLAFWLSMPWREKQQKRNIVQQLWYQFTVLHGFLITTLPWYCVR
jgi:hypothetical protein